ncbi:hypothetical protein CALCODRAFT_421085, partial [Calocera cornea HHB12733]
KCCLAGTRQNIFEEAWSWIDNYQRARTSEVFWISDVAGSGKSTIAHSLCQQAREKGILWSCFFFDRMSAERSTPNMFITTLIRDLAALDQKLGEEIADILQREPSLCSASFSRQLKDIVLRPSVIDLYPKGRGLIVVDALDEAWSEALFEWFSDGVPKLNANIRFVVTSRPIAEVGREFGPVS